MDIEKEEYQHKCPLCGSRSKTGLINFKNNKKEYYCLGCFCEFEVSEGVITVYKLSANGQRYPVETTKK